MHAVIKEFGKDFSSKSIVNVSNSDLLLEFICTISVFNFASQTYKIQYIS